MDVELERLREKRMELEGRERALNIIDKIIGKTEVCC